MQEFVMAIIGYARTSRLKQEAGLAAQQRDLVAAGCTKIFSEQASSVAERPELERAIDYLREGDADVFVVTKLDRFARSISDAIELEKRIAAKGATLRILGTGIDTSTPVGRMMFGMLAVVAQFEREIMLERQREGIAAAAAAGKYKGRKPINADRVAEVRRLALEEKLGKAEIARRMQAAGTPVSLRSVFSILGSASG
jgi:DNA invertase Pin-like site-specific DNA recombinase